MRVPQTRYRIPDFFKDDNWHIINKTEDFPLSRKDPLSLYIGVTTVIPERYGVCTKLKSNWLWRYGFTSANSTNFWSTSTGSNGSIAPGNWGVNVNAVTYYTIADGNTVSEGYITTGSSGNTRTTLQTINFSSYNDWYFSPSITVPSSSSSRAIVCRFKATYEADLPTNMYTISNNVITWNNTPILLLLQGKEFIPY